jgi:hypothetical protein
MAPTLCNRSGSDFLGNGDGFDAVGRKWFRKEVTLLLVKGGSDSCLLRVEVTLAC